MAKIFITGTSGIGKTTLAKYIAEREIIPFIDGSSKVLWGKFGIKSHLDILKMGLNDPEMGLLFQNQLLDERIRRTEGVESFVTDRSVIDNAVYFLYQNSGSLSQEKTGEYLQKCFDYFRSGEQLGSKVIYLSHKVKGRVLEDDSMRIANPFFQDLVIGPIFESVVKEFDKQNAEIFQETELKPESRNISIHTIKVWPWKQRLNIIDPILNGK